MLIGTFKQIFMEKAHFEIITIIKILTIINLYFEIKVVECVADLNKNFTFYIYDSLNFIYD